jgi:hypothetical protein
MGNRDVRGWASSELQAPIAGSDANPQIVPSVIRSSTHPADAIISLSCLVAMPTGRSSRMPAQARSVVSRSPGCLSCQAEYGQSIIEVIDHSDQLLSVLLAQTYQCG